MISLVVATYNRLEVLMNFFDSVLNSGVKFEIVLIDQNDLLDLKDLIHKYRSFGLDIEYIKISEKNLSKARNFGISICKYDIIGFPDDDCFYDPSTLLNIVNHFENNITDVLVGRWLEIDFKYRKGLIPLDRSEILNFKGIPTSSITVFFRKCCLEKIGGFDVRLGVGQWFGAGEETDLIIRATKAGFFICYDYNVIVHHKFVKVEDYVNYNLNFKRQRGVGAIYIKNKMPVYIILRGLFSPIWRALFCFNSIMFINNILIFSGRIIGSFFWLLKYSNRENAYFSRINQI